MGYIATCAYAIQASLSLCLRQPSRLPKSLAHQGCLAGFCAKDLDPDEPIWLMPGSIPASRVDIFEGNERGNSLLLKGFFDHAAPMDAIGHNGNVEVTVAVKLLSGKWVYGAEILRVK